MKSLFTRLMLQEEGQDLIEYALLASLISIGSVVLMMELSGPINGLFQSVIDAL